MSVRAKFQVTQISQSTAWGNGPHETSEVTMNAVSGEANKTWSKWTPGGTLKMQINNPEALNQFKIGEFYFLDFSPAPAKEADEQPAK
jgi:hypothetical protein